MNPLDALKTQMRWHEARQGVLAQNVANADTPNYRARDLEELKFDRLTDRATGHIAPPVTTKTHPGHYETRLVSTSMPFDSEKSPGFEVTPEGNAVVLEEQMMKVTANQLDYQTATLLYTKGLGLIRKALGRNG